MFAQLDAAEIPGEQTEQRSKHAVGVEGRLNELFMMKEGTNT